MFPRADQLVKGGLFHQLDLLYRNCRSSENELLQGLHETPSGAPSPHLLPTRAPDYMGDHNLEVDEPFSLAGIVEVVYNLSRITTPVRHKIPKKLLQHLDHVAVENQLNYINCC